MLPLNLVLDLESFRLGAFKSWQSKPGAGFHGCLADVKIYRGVLTEQEAADLFAAGRDVRETD